MGDIKQCGIFGQGIRIFLLGYAKNVSGSEDVELDREQDLGSLTVCKHQTTFVAERDLTLSGERTLHYADDGL